MAKTLLLASFMLLAAAAFAADKIEALELDFLDYLGSMESDEDNWTLLDSSDQEPLSEDAEAARPGEKAAAPSRSSKEAAKPAVEER